VVLTPRLELAEQEARVELEATAELAGNQDGAERTEDPYGRPKEHCSRVDRTADSNGGAEDYRSGADRTEYPCGKADKLEVHHDKQVGLETIATEMVQLNTPMMEQMEFKSTELETTKAAQAEQMTTT
ncbi:hypothetical protein M9458_025994, partial [Cirrhinus mrigala]